MCVPNLVSQQNPSCCRTHSYHTISWCRVWARRCLGMPWPGAVSSIPTRRSRYRASGASFVLRHIFIFILCRWHHCAASHTVCRGLGFVRENDGIGCPTMYRKEIVMLTRNYTNHASKGNHLAYGFGTTLGSETCSSMMPIYRVLRSAQFSCSPFCFPAENLAQQDGAGGAKLHAPPRSWIRCGSGNGTRHQPCLDDQDEDAAAG